MAGSPDPPAGAGRWWTLAAVCVATFMLLLDITIVNVALPSIQKDFKANLSDLQWVVDAYALALASLNLTAGTLADTLGRRRVFAFGLGAFTVASLLCGLATSSLFLNVARAFQGVGGAVMFACALALIAHAFRGPERGTAFGAWGASIGAAIAVGPLVGGALTDALNWRWIFLVNVPIGIGAVLLTLAKVEESRNPGAGRVDWPGVVTFSSALFLLVLALIRGNSQGWSSANTLLELAGAGALLLAFVVIELRSESPMFELSLFRIPAFAGVSAVAFCLSAGLFAMFLYLTLYIQNGLHYTPLQTGVRFLPITLLAFFVAPIAGRLASRSPPRFLFVAGLGLVGAGLLLMHGITDTSGFGHLMPGFLCIGAGMGLANPTIATVAVGVVDPQRGGMAAGISNTFRQVGIATGIAGLGAIFQSRAESKTSAVLEHASTVVAQHSHAIGRLVGKQEVPQAIHQAPASARMAVAGAAHHGFISALNDLLLVGGVVCLAGALLGLALVRTRDLAHTGEAPAEALAA